MTFVINQGCCKDSSCIPVCPVQCIRPRPGDPDFTTAEQLYIDPATCIDCGACMDECPVNAIDSEFDLSEESADYLDINAEYFAANPIAESLPPDLVYRKLPAGRAELSVAIVGSGPAACYAAGELSDIKGVTVSMFERLPTPFGLVRAGVAPDHPRTKQIANRFGSVLARPGVHCFFNTEVGRDISIDELLEHHHAVLWAGGADDDRRLGIPGEELPGCFSAREFVAWYNGHPDFTGHRFDLTGRRAVVLGNGNVALDAARVLARPVGALEPTDIAPHAVELLGASRIEDVVVAARRGPEHAAYSTGELLALDSTEGVALRAVPGEADSLAGRTDRQAAVVQAAVVRAAGRESGGADGGERTITLRYGLTPVSVNGDGAVESVTFRRADGSTETIETSFVLRAVGYRGRSVAGLPFDDVTGTLPHRSGAVYDPESGMPVVGVYCAGWIKRGANGMIGSNRTDSAETVEALLDDLAGGRLTDPVHDVEHLAQLVSERNPDVVDKHAWTRIDQAERRLGREAGRARVKLVSVAELLAASRVTS
ncbi:FAD-dependent oxidoreductase [Streptomyces sp. BH-SS-21]|uniref:ferredoxin--NADP(+) reductase n=1 Tax=Streptomyces liliiviolaceus TaxID=2823109 RepID=A0A940XZZ5_9ACTN|nr:FAD-dependent oxidoreductase [Streptomyces liliiviolaceus]MBQ0850747.1 FAD-dependent oxidoreductase [Streptomyces liliiviolaceus]